MQVLRYVITRKLGIIAARIKLSDVSIPMSYIKSVFHINYVIENTLTHAEYVTQLYAKLKANRMDKRP